MLILDFVGISANVDLVSHESFLEPANDTREGDDSETFGTVERDESEDIPEERTVDINLNIQALAKGIKSRTRHEYDAFDPFEATGASHESVIDLTKGELSKDPPISFKQYRQLCKYGVGDESLTRAEAQKLIGFIAGKGWQLRGYELTLLKKLHQEILNERAVFG